MAHIRYGQVYNQLYCPSFLLSDKLEIREKKAGHEYSVVHHG
jgi:hypothetical protein